MLTLYQNIIHNRTYARERDSRLETYEETVDRYIDYLKSKIVDEFLREEIEECREMIKKQEIMPSMRLFFSAGKAVEAENAMAFNCKYQALDTVKSFADLLYSLLCTCGVGVSVQLEHVSRLPTLPKEIYESSTSITVPDNRKGWAQSLQILLEKIYSTGECIQFNVNEVRPKGAPLLTSGGYASGPEPLLEMRNFITNIVKTRQGQQLRPVDCFDIACMIAQCAIQGGVRRAAIITLFDDTDTDMLYVKSVENLKKYPHRYNSNNTMVWRGDHALLDRAMEQTRINGEPGYFFKANVEKKMKKLGRTARTGFGINPCVTGDTLILTRKGYFPISELVDKPVEIWNGFEWSDVVPFDTGENVIYEITFSNQIRVKCTEYHKWHTKNGIITTKELISGETELVNYTLPDNNITTTGIKVIYQRQLPPEKTYCLTEPKNHTFIANGVITGNCGEIVLQSNSLCNLAEVVLRPKDSLHKDMRKTRYATLLALAQATLTDYHFITEETKHNQEEDPILGISLTGLCDCPNYSAGKYVEDYLSILKGVAESTVDETWQMFGIKNRPKAITCIKPSGTVSQLVNSSSGIHPRYAKHYVRRVLIGEESHLYNTLAHAGVPYLEFKEISGRVFEFPLKSPDESIVIKDVTAIKQLNYINTVNTYWCDHNASCTIYVKKDDWEAVIKLLKTEHSFLALSFLPYEISTDTSGYLYLPYEEISEEEYKRRKDIENNIKWESILAYSEGMKSGHCVQFACVGGACEI